MSAPAEDNVAALERSQDESDTPVNTKELPPTTTLDTTANNETAKSRQGSSSEPGELSDNSDADEKSSAGDDKTSSQPDTQKTDDGHADAPPLPSEPVPQQEDDGWEYHWNANTSSYWFYNRITGVWQQENPRLNAPPTLSAPAPTAPGSTAPPLPSGTAPGASAPVSVAGGYNPAIHGDYDPNAWYAQASRAAEEAATNAAAQETAVEYVSGGFFNRHTGAWQSEDQGPARHSDEAKSKRQLNAYFDVDAAANEHDGRSLKAERAGKKPTKAELKAFKEKRKARKEEKRRAWLRD